MKIFKNSISLLFLIFTFLGCTNTSDISSSKERFNNNWHFKIVEDSAADQDVLQSEYSSWQKVNIPHTPKIEPRIVNNQFQGISWYKKEFFVTPELEGKKLFIEFEGAMNIAEVWVNGQKMITHHGGYLPFVIDISTVAKFDETNLISVKLNNKDNPVTGPKPLNKLDFNTYGGIYRNVWLITKNPLYITHPILENKEASGGIFVTYSDVSEAMANVHIKTHIRNESLLNEKCIVKHTLFFDDEIIQSVESDLIAIQSKTSVETKDSISLVIPELWSPDHPNLYTLKTEIIRDDIIVDVEEQKIGIKTMKFVGQDFYLNGKKHFLRGVNRHKEYPYIGYALSEKANYRDAKKIKEAGFDYVRLSHYPQSNAFMDACDELGLVTINAILGWQYYSQDDKFKSHVYQTAKDLIRRDRNRASVIAWEVSLNESWMPESFIDSLTTIAKREYPTDQCFTAGWQEYGYDIYLQARQHRLDHYNPDSKKPYNVSEYGDWEYYAMNAGLNQDSWGDLLQEERSSRQLRGNGEVALLQQATNVQEAHNDNYNTPAFADGYWVMYDYNRGYADDLEASGLMDLYRLPKFAHYFYQSQRSPEASFGRPMVFIANYWTEHSPLDVRIFSNCEEVELVLNGVSLGKQKADNNDMTTNLNFPPFTFNVPKFAAGELVANAFIDGKVVTSHKIQTPEIPSKIEIEIDYSTYDIDKEQEDILFVYAKVVDENGTVNPNFKDEIEFEISGDAELIGDNPIQIEAGIASILMKTQPNSKSISISAKAKNSKLSGHLKLNN